MSDSKAGVIGCLGFLYAVAAVFFVAAWFGVPFGYDSRGLSAVFASDQVYTTGTVVRVDRAGTTSSQASRPVIEYAVDGRHERFYGGANNLHGLHRGDTVPIAYSRSDRSTAHIRSFSDEFLLPLMMTVFGLPFLALAVSGTINNVRRS